MTGLLDGLPAGTDLPETPPAVVAVVVTRDPGPWFEECLAALGAQDYPELSVLVLVSGGSEDPTARVAAVLPDAYVRRLPEDRGFGAAVNEALAMVEGAAFLLLCHDDCAPAPDAVHILVEESFRSNAGVVGPKMVRWAEPDVLLHVGMSADKTGASVERIQPGEVDHGQHDGVRDVFFLPGGLTLVRADLLSALGGFDAAMVAMGEDLDFCWRAQVAGSRVVVEPDAVVRHLEATAGGLRSPPPPPDGAAPSLQELQRRHELRAVLKNYGWWNLLWVLPQAAILALGEVLTATFAGDRRRVRVVSAAWRWNLHHLGEVRRARAANRAVSRVPDRQVRQLQLRGSARLATYLSRLSHQGFEAAHGRMADETVEESDEPELTGSVGLAFSEDADFDELDDLGHRAGRDRFGRARRRPILGTTTSRLVAWAAVVIVLVIGTRDLLAASFPLVGQLAPMLSWTATWHHLWAGWQPAGVGTTAPATSAFAVLGSAGTVLLGGMGLAQKVLVLACIPVGAYGTVTLVRPLGSPRARLVAAVSYLGLALPYNALSAGRWDGLVAFAVMPFLVVRLARATRLPPFDTGRPAAGWRGTAAGQVAVLGAIEAVAVAFAPAVAPAMLLCAVGFVGGSLLVGGWRPALRALGFGAAATAVAAVLLAPWVIGTLLAGHQAVGVFGLPGAPWSAANPGALVRFAVGPLGSSPLSWLVVVAALLPLLVGRDHRLAWATRFWAVAVLSWLLAWAAGRGWTSPFAPSVTVVLAPAAVAMAASVGLGVASFEADLVGYRFGWRQVVSAGAMVVLVVGLLPVVGAAGDGRWGLPATGYEQALSFLSAGSGAGRPGAAAGSGAVAGAGGFRVLWLGDPRALPIGAWSAGPGLAYGTSEDGVPGAVDLWAPAGSGPTDTLAAAVTQAEQGGTQQLGRLLAAGGVRYVVVVQSIAPQVAGVQSPPSYPVAPTLQTALAAQTDLQAVAGGPSDGYVVYLNTVALPERAARAGGPVITTTQAGLARPALGDLAGWSGVLPGPAGAGSYTGTVPAGTTYAGYAPAGNWHLTVSGRSARSRPAFGWAAQWPAGSAGPATLQVDGSPLVPLGVALQGVAVVALALLLLGVRRWPRRPGWMGGRPSRTSTAERPPDPVPEAAAAGAAR